MSKISLKNVVWKEGKDYVSWNLNTGVSSFGDTKKEALESLKEKGVHTQMLSFRLLSPFPTLDFETYLPGIKRLFVIEQNHSGQFYHYLKSMIETTIPIHPLSVPGPVPITSQQITEFVLQRETVHD